MTEGLLKKIKSERGVYFKYQFEKPPTRVWYGRSLGNCNNFYQLIAQSNFDGSLSRFTTRLTKSSFDHITPDAMLIQIFEDKSEQERDMLANELFDGFIKLQ